MDLRLSPDGMNVASVVPIASMTAIGCPTTAWFAFSTASSTALIWNRCGSPEPVAVDHDLNTAYGFKDQDGRMAFYSLALDGSMREKLIDARPDVDVDQMMHIGRNNRVIGVSYATDYRRAVYFDPKMSKLAAALAKALPQHTNMQIVDANSDESKLLTLVTSSDRDPGVYYLFDRKLRRLQTFFLVRNQLEDDGPHVQEGSPADNADKIKVPGLLINTTFHPYA